MDSKKHKLTKKQVELLKQKAIEAIKKTPYEDGKFTARCAFEDFFQSLGIKFDL